MVKQQTINATSDTGKVIKITLEQWAENLIDRALARHKIECPVTAYNKEHLKTQQELDRRVAALEVKLKIVQWLIAPFYVGFVGWVIMKLTH